MNNFGILSILIYCGLLRISSGCFETYKNQSKLILPKDSTDLYYSRPYSRYRIETNISSCTITCSNLYSIKEIFYTYKTTDYQQFLNITNSNITKLLPNDFTQFETITKLYLTGNYIEEISPQAFFGLIELEELYLNQNNISQIVRNVFESLYWLEKLDLSKNRIRKIENQAFEHLEKLEILDLSDNYLIRIDAQIFSGLNKLSDLLLTGNPLIGNFTAILAADVNDLFLGRMNLTKFEYINYPNYYLVRLNLDNNVISRVNLYLYPKSFELSFRNNQITKIEGQYGILINLFLSGNRFEVIDNFFLNQTLLGLLDLSFNQIHTIQVNAFVLTPLLENLILHHNQISQLKVGTFHNLEHLQVLDLSHNHIKEIQFGTFSNLNSLLLLNISYNNLNALHEHTLDSLDNLMLLKFDNNNITQFNASSLTNHLISLHAVSLHDNPWKCETLGHIISVFKLSKVLVYQGSVFDTENINGIACSKDNSTKFVSSAQEIDFGKILNNTVKESFERILRETINSTNILPKAKPVESVQSQTSNNGTLIFILILQFLMCFILLGMGFMLFKFLQKFRGNNQFQLVDNEYNT